MESRRGGRPAAELPTGTLTFFFSDIESSTRLLHALGDAFPSVLDAHQAILRGVFGRHDGVEVSTEGDSFFAVFPSATEAAAAAVEVQRALAEAALPGDARIRVRIGLHTGEAVPVGDNYGGLDVHRAARIADAGHGGQVLLSAATHALIEGRLPEGARAEDLGAHRLRDLDRPERLFQIAVGGLDQDFPPPRSLDARPNNLPVQLTSFVGRDREVKGVRDLLSRARLATLTGPGGTGKTRLALQSAAASLDDFADGVFFVPLAPIQDPALVASTVAQALRIDEETGRSIVDTVGANLRDKDLLLVLDNFEQVMDAASVVTDILRAASEVKILVTSRAPLHLSGEHEFQVPPMELPDPENLPTADALSQYESVALFIERALAVKSDFEVTNGNAPAVAEICARLDGLPLAIELAAARVRLLTAEGILDRLSNRLGLLTGGARDLPERQQTLRAAIDWSFDLLDDSEKTLFRRVSVFAGGWELDAAEAVCSPDGELDTLDALESLVDKSLVRRDAGGGLSRFRMLALIREYGEESLDLSDERETIRDRHAAHFLQIAKTARSRLTGDDQTAWLDRLVREHDNMRAALRWAIDSGRTETGLRLGAALWRFWHLRGHLAEGRKWLEGLLSLPGAQGRTKERAWALSAAGSLIYWQNDYSLAISHYRESLDIFQELGHEQGAAEQLYNLAYATGATGDLQGGREHNFRALELYRKIGDPLGIANALTYEGGIRPIVGEVEGAVEMLEEALSVYRELGNAFGAGNVLGTLGTLRYQSGDFRGAADALLEAMPIFADSGDMSGVAMGLNMVAHTALEQGKFECALHLSGAASVLNERLGGGAPPVLAQIEDPRSRAAEVMSAEEVRDRWNEGRALTAEQAIEEANEFALELASSRSTSPAGGESSLRPAP